MDPKIQFGVDYFCVSTLLSSYASSTENFSIFAQVSFLFLTLWDFNRWEIDEVVSIYNKHFVENSLLHEKAFERLVVHFTDQPKEIQLKFIKQLATLSHFDFEVTDSQQELMNIIMKEFDLRPSEFREAEKQGLETAVFLNIFASTFTEESVEFKGEDYLKKS